ncbi:MAG: 4-amino-4-deoxy-L-arabinose transferase [Leptolyngbya sp. SIO1D8]|nr:4-amino-4-deoxy-L-arabinose transferase [Leptolyngbya sp. SIO1D8]
MKIARPVIPKVVWWWLGGGLGCRAVVATLLPAGFDEVYYYLYSRHLNWSYFDHPPIVALTTGIGWWLTGTIAPLTIRAGALGLYTLTLVLLYWLADYLFDAKTGIIAVAIASISPLLWITFGTLTAPDNGLIVFWTLTVLIAAYEFIPGQASALAPAKAIAYQPSYRIALLGLTLGLACLSKYHGFVLGLGLVGFCLTCDRTRKALWSPWTALALLTFLLTLLPLWAWNSQHDWISFRFHLGMRFDGGPSNSGEANPYRILDAFGTWLLGIVYLFPTIGFPLWWRTGRSLVQQIRDWIQPPFTAKEAVIRDRTALILWVSLPIALGFTLLGGKQAIYPAWPAPGFWGLLLLLAHAASSWRLQTLRRWLSGTGLVLGTLVFVALLHLSLGFLQKPSHYALFGGFIAPEQDGSTALLDVGQLRARVADDPKLTQVFQETDFIFTDEFYLSGYVDMALYPLAQLPMTCFSQDPRGFAFWHDPDTWIGQDALYITLASLHPDLDELAAEFQPYFQTLESLQKIPLTRGGAATETVLFYRAAGMQQSYVYPYPST